jgi:hypothetical protein
MCTDRSLWVGTSHATNQDLSGLFVARCIEQYLRQGGRFGFVMPLATLTRGAYDGFRRGNYSAPTARVAVVFERPWDLHLIKKSFFPVPACVVFGTRQDDSGGVRLDQLPDVWAGRFETKTASLNEALKRISRTIEEPRRALAVAASPYARKFGQGATVVPQVLFLVECEDSGPLGVGAGRVAVRSYRSVQEKRPWRDVPSLSGVVERKFIRSLYRGDSVLPYRCGSRLSAVIPWDGNRLLGNDEEQIHLYPGLAEWWHAAEKVWNRKRSSDQLSLTEQLDYRRKLSRQLPGAKYRVVYGASGMYLAAAVVTDQSAVIEHQLYWGSVGELEEARFLVAVLNSGALTMAVRPLQARGEHNPRHFDKYVFQLPIPLYDRADDRHRRLVDLAEQAERIAESVVLPAKRFETQRSVIRNTLAQLGVAVEIDSIVKELLA